VSEPTCVVAVDVGNSAAKLCVRRGKIAPTEFGVSVSIGSKNWQSQAIEWVREHAGCRKTHWRVASVNQSAAESLKAAVEKDVQTAKQSSVDFVTRHDIPMAVLVDEPDRLGIDRLLSAYGAKLLSGCGPQQHPARPLVVVDAGSAVTIDWVDARGQFCGGAILPGLRMQADSLAKGTDALPEIDWQSWTCRSVPATNTVDAIRLGLISGISSSIDRLTKNYAKGEQGDANETTGHDSSSPQLILTGGDASLISPYVQYPHEVVPNLVCRGVLELP
jgi:type III pantothenate kinase